MDGILLVDKPQGVSSNHILQRVKRLYGAAKAGHTGALDPLATGMLPLALGEATKFSQFLLDADKRYITTAKLGIRTDSSDADGQVVEQKPVPQDLTEQQIVDLLEKHFSGQIEQVPSMFSALKHNGQPLYKLAREGKKVEVKPRTVTIYEIKLTGFRGDEVDLEVFCSKGTYIRSIVEDLGLLIGCGAHVSMLRRLDSGPFKSPDMLTYEQLEQVVAQQPQNADEAEQNRGIQAALDKLLLPAWSAIGHLPVLAVDEQQKGFLANGRSFTCDFPDTPLVRLHVESDQQFLGIGEVAQGRLQPKRLLSVFN